MPKYDADRFAPPAPVTTVEVRTQTDSKRTSEVTLQIDSGADVTLLPDSILQALQLTIDPNDRYELEGFDGQRSFAAAVSVDVRVLQKTVRGKFLLTESEVGVLGRDVLNLFRIRLDGPALEWEQV